MADISFVKLPRCDCHRATPMTIHHWSNFRKWLGAVGQQAITWVNVNPVLCHHKALQLNHEVPDTWVRLFDSTSTCVMIGLGMIQCWKERVFTWVLALLKNNQWYMYKGSHVLIEHHPTISISMKLIYLFQNANSALCLGQTSLVSWVRRNRRQKGSSGLLLA